MASFLEEKVNVVAFDLVEMEEESCLVGTEVASYQEETEVVEIQEEMEEASYQEGKERNLNFDWVA